MSLQLVIHAPDEASLARARSNARNLLAAAPDARCEIVVNAEAVSAAIDQRDPSTDGLLILCGNTLRSKGLKAPADRSTGAPGPSPRAPARARALRRTAERW